MWSLRTAPDTRIPSTAHPARSGEKYCTTLIFLMSLIYLSYRFLPFAIIAPVGRTYESMWEDEGKRDGDGEGLGVVPRYIIYNSTVTFSRFCRCCRSCCALCMTFNNNNMRHIWINQFFYCPILTFALRNHLNSKVLTKHVLIYFVYYIDSKSS